MALLWPEPMVTLDGTARDPLLLLSETIAALRAALFNETVQLLEALLPSDVGEHDTEVSCAGALAVMVNAWEAPFSEAVSNAV